MTAQSDLLSRLNDWYVSQCDGDWEHQCGITIESLDNPGWRMRIDLTGTPEQHRRDFVDQRDIDDNRKWMVLKKDGNVFEGAGAPARLDAIVTGFLKWKDGSDG